MKSSWIGELEVQKSQVMMESIWAEFKEWIDEERIGFKYFQVRKKLSKESVYVTSWEHSKKEK